MLVVVNDLMALFTFCTWINWVYFILLVTELILVPCCLRLVFAFAISHLLVCKLSGCNNSNDNNNNINNNNNNNNNNSNNNNKDNYNNYYYYNNDRDDNDAADDDNGNP